MNSDQKALSLVAFLTCLTITACIAIMAQCSIRVNATDTQIAECVKAAHHWNYNGGNGFCEEAVK